MPSRRNAKNLGMAIITLADPKAGALLKVIDEAQKFVAKPRRRLKSGLSRWKLLRRNARRY